MRIIGRDMTDDYIPRLVERCRRYDAEAELDIGKWYSLGIWESIHPEEARKEQPR